MLRSKEKKYLSGVEKTVLHKDLSFTAIEQYKLLRTNLAFTLPEEESCPVIGITSAVRGEGKSTTAINLAYVLAENGDKVLLIDADLRLPSIAKRLEIKNATGLTDVLMDSEKQSISVFKSKVSENLSILPSGTLPPNPSELIGSHRMESLLKSLKNNFDYIIVDLPPVDIVSDALAISPCITGMIVVVRENYTTKRDLNTCMRQLEFSHVNILGTVINQSGSEPTTYGKHYKYYKYYKKQ